LKLNTFHFYRFTQSNKYKGRFHSERPHNGETGTENAVREGEDLTQGSLICLTRLILTKVLF